MSESHRFWWNGPHNWAIQPFQIIRHLGHSISRIKSTEIWPKGSCKWLVHLNNLTMDWKYIFIRSLIYIYIYRLCLLAWFGPFWLACIKLSLAFKDCMLQLWTQKKLLLLTSIFVGDNQMLKANHFSEKDKCHWENNRDIQIQARDCMDG